MPDRKVHNNYALSAGYFYRHEKGGKYLFQKNTKRGDIFFSIEKRGSMRYFPEILIIRVILLVQLKDYNTNEWMGLVVCVLCSTKHAKI